jgi:hypothetical protein
MSSISKTGASGALKFEEDLVFATLAGRPRRKLLVALANGGPQMAADLLHAGKGRFPNPNRTCNLEATLKNLKVMVDAGIVLQLENPQDRRRPLYALTPGLTVALNSEHTTVDFGCCMVRLSPDGD